ncbi:MAG: hypothetical protein R2691_00630 [Solirubrobacterales bacterium]
MPGERQAVGDAREPPRAQVGEQRLVEDQVGVIVVGGPERRRGGRRGDDPADDQRVGPEARDDPLGSHSSPEVRVGDEDALDNARRERLDARQRRLGVIVGARRGRQARREVRPVAGS